MKATNKILLLSISVIVSVFNFISCDDSGDTTAPVINLIAPAEGANLKIGSDIHFDMEISDNEMLKSYSVEIHNNFNNHGHDLKSGETTKPFQFNKSWDVSGHKNKHEHHHHIEITEDATPGDYHLMVFCTDAAGNEAHIARNIILSHNGETGQHED